MPIKSNSLKRLLNKFKRNKKQSTMPKVYIVIHSLWGHVVKLAEEGSFVLAMARFPILALLLTFVYFLYFSHFY